MNGVSDVSFQSDPKKGKNIDYIFKILIWYLQNTGKESFRKSTNFITEVLRATCGPNALLPLNSWECDSYKQEQ